MPRFVFFLLTLGLLAAQSPTDSGESPDRGWAIDPDGSTISAEDPDRGWGMDPDGSTTSSEEIPNRGWEMDPDG